MGPWGPWMHGPMPFFMGPAFFHLIWLFLIGRSLLSPLLPATDSWSTSRGGAWCGRNHYHSVLSIFRFPFGTAMAIWTLIMLLGYRNQTLYEQL